MSGLDDMSFDIDSNIVYIECSPGDKMGRMSCKVVSSQGEIYYREKMWDGVTTTESELLREFHTLISKVTMC